jgi:hypothetical protein
LRPKLAGAQSGAPRRRTIAGSSEVKETAMSTHAAFIAITAAAAITAAGCSQQASAPAAAIKDRFYTVAPDALKVRAGVVSGEVTEMKVMERVEEGSGRVTAPARLTGKLVLKNVSRDQSVRLIGGKIVYIDTQGKPIALEGNRTAPIIRVSSQYGSSEQRLDPGQDSSQSIDADFPVEALKAKRLKDIRIELSYIPSPYREEALNFGVAIGGQ